MRPYSKALPRYLRILAGKAILPLCFIDYHISRFLVWVWPQRYTGKDEVHLGDSFLNRSVLVIACYIQTLEDFNRLQSLCDEMIEEVTILVINTGSFRVNMGSAVSYLNRPNYGRDLFSYAIGINMLRNSQLDHILLVNDSVYWQRGALSEFWQRARNMDSAVVSMTDSFQGSFHLQSFAFCINRPLEEVLIPFNAIKPSYMKRTLVEFGEKKLSRLWMSASIQIDAVWRSDFLASSLHKYKRLYFDDFTKLENLIRKSIPVNPSIHFWPILFTEAGVLKKSLVLRNPAQFQQVPKSLSDCRVMIEEIQ